jgi:hypothetical protein
MYKIVFEGIIEIKEVFPEKIFTQYDFPIEEKGGYGENNQSL